MKGLVLALVAAVAMVGCTEDRLRVIHNNDRVTELERRAALNDQLNTLQNQRLDALEAQLAAEEAARTAADAALSADLQQEVDDRAAADAALNTLITNEKNARIAGDMFNAMLLGIEIANRIAGDAANSAALHAAMFTQSLTNFSLQSQINTINSKLVVVNGKLTSLQNQINNLDSRVDDLEDQMEDAQEAMADLEASLQAQLDNLSVQQAATQAQLNAEGVKVYKCNSASSTERILKINGKFYAAMNRVTTQSVQVVTGSSSSTYTTPDMCRTFFGDLELPNSGGQCTPVSGPFKSTKIPGQTIVVPSYTTASVTVVDSVKIALDKLVDGSYSTTDGGPACSFSISSGGTTSSNLVSVQ